MISSGFLPDLLIGFLQQASNDMRSLATSSEPNLQAKCKGVSLNYGLNSIVKIIQIKKYMRWTINLPLFQAYLNTSLKDDLI